MQNKKLDVARIAKQQRKSCEFQQTPREPLNKSSGSRGVLAGWDARRLLANERAANGVLANPPFASAYLPTAFANRATQTARQESARRVGTRNGVSSAPGLPNECLASYIKYDLPRLPNKLTPNLSHFRAHLANPAIHEHLFRGSLVVRMLHGETQGGLR